MNKFNHKSIHEAFLIGIIIKALIGFFEILAGIGFYFSGDLLHRVVVFAQLEVIRNPHDYLAMLVVRLLLHVPVNEKLFGMIYLVSRGGIKLALIVALLKDKLWAYPGSIALIVAFMIYQIYGILVSHSIFLIILTLFDSIVVWLIWQEYTYRRSHPHAKKGDTLLTDESLV